MATATNNLPAVQENKQVLRLREVLVANEARLAQNITGALRLNEVINGTIELARSDTKLARCEPETVLLGVLSACQLGLSLNRNLGHAYLVPFKNGYLTKRMERDVYEALFLIGYKGLLHMIRGADPNIHSVSATIVYDSEPFAIRGGDQRGIDHTPDPDKPSLDHYRGAYSIITYKDGSAPDFEYMSRVEIEKIRAASKASDDGPWKSWPEEMIRKTVMRRHCKRLPLIPKVAEAINRDEAIDLGYDRETQSYQVPRANMPREIGSAPAEPAQLSQGSDSEAPAQAKEQTGGGSGAAPSATPICPKCGGATKFVKAGTNKAGKAYGAFWACTRGKEDCGGTVSEKDAAKQAQPAPAAASQPTPQPDYRIAGTFYAEFQRLRQEHPEAVANALKSEDVQSVDDLGDFGRAELISVIHAAIKG